MKTLYESLLDDFDELDKNTESNIIKHGIDDYMKQYYKPCKYTVSNKPNKDDKYVVDISGDIKVKNYDIYTLTNNLFIFGKVTGSFYCTGCKKLISLEGAPIKVGWSFDCEGCDNLTSLEGAPKEVGAGFYCTGCKKLISLEGAPEIVQGHFYCNDCSNLKSLEGAPKKIGWSFDCSKCNNLTSLKGVPEKIGHELIVPPHLKK